VLPLHGGRLLMPGPVLVRARLGEALDVGRVRAALAFLAEACDAARSTADDDARWWLAPVELRVGRMADEALLTLDEAEAALAELEAARVLIPAERGHRIDADVLCECPALGGVDLAAAKQRIRGGGALVAPATALLREIVRIADAEGVAGTTLPRLTESTLYGRTRITQSLALLERLALVERVDLPNRTVRLRLRDGSRAAALPPASRASTPAPAAGGTRMRLPINVPLQVGGEPLVLAPGMVPELELGADGRYYLWLGPVRLGPYDG
jgi:multidrug efflux pump subunit AcrA (membrane-fusion protein)